MNLIVNADENWGIGCRNKLLVRIPEDMEFFRGRTMGNVVVMGRRTLESLPGGLPLKGRTNLILTGNPRCHVEGAAVLHSVEEALEELKKYPSKDVYIIGGGSVYRAFLPYCNVAYVTRVRRAYEADTYFPDLDRDPEWLLAGESGEKSYAGLEFTFCCYERRGM